MQKQNLKKSIVSFALIVSTILMPLSFLPEKAEAQYGTLGGVSGYVRGLAPAIAKLPQCREEIGSGIKKLFSGIGDLFSGEAGGLPYEPTDDITGEPISTDTTNAETLDERASTKTIQVTTPGVSDQAVLNELKKLGKTASKIEIETAKINEQSSCIASIGRLITKMLLQKLTLSTVNWINSGYDGSPSFIQNPEKFFKDIAKKEILQFGIEINGISPFSKDWMRNNALALKNKFADNARYSLEEMIAQTTPECKGEDGVITGCDEAFSKDFSVGGWDAWTAMTQVPANNPLGAKLLFDNEIQKRLAGTNQSTAQDTRDALKEASGFLGDQRCADPKGVTIEEDDLARRVVRKINPTTDIGEPANPNDPNADKRFCNRWEYVTPGKMLADAATNVMGYPNNSFLNVQDLNDAVAAVSDAILNQFSTSIYEKGFANLDYQGIDGVLVFNNSNSDFRTQTEKDYIPSQLSSSWLQANPDFNIRIDLTQALIDEQRTYSDKLALQNKELMSTTDGKDYTVDGSTWIVCAKENETCFFPGTQKIRYGAQGSYKEKTATGSISCNNATFGDPIYMVEKTCTYNSSSSTRKVSNAYGLMPAIYQLDYCIPGPHPGWEQDSLATLSVRLNSIEPPEETKPNVAGNIANGAIGIGLQLAGDAILPGAGQVLSLGWGMLSSTFGGDAERSSTNIRGYYTGIFNSLTGYQPQAVYGSGQDNISQQMSSSAGLFSIFNTILTRYIKIMNKTYFSNPDILPVITKEAAKEFEQLSGYNQIMKDNKNRMLEIKTTVSILGEIKYKVDELNADLETNKKTEEQYEEALKFQINAFGRLSASMVNGDDIAAADDLAKQIVQKKDFIYKNLLKGPYGCEADLEKLDSVPDNVKNFPSANPGVMQTSNDWSNYNVNSVKRMTYPFPILYDYNEITAGATIPDPWNSGYDEDKLPKMPAENKYNEYGPGFLSFVYFGTTVDDRNKQRLDIYNGKERLTLDNLVNNHNPLYQNEGAGWNDEWGGMLWTSLGTSNISEILGLKTRTGGLFEKTIGVY